MFSLALMEREGRARTSTYSSENINPSTWPTLDIPATDFLIHWSKWSFAFKVCSSKEQHLNLLLGPIRVKCETVKVV